VAREIVSDALETASCGIGKANCGVRTADCGVETANCGVEGRTRAERCHDALRECRLCGTRQFVVPPSGGSFWLPLRTHNRLKAGLRPRQVRKLYNADQRCATKKSGGRTFSLVPTDPRRLARRVNMIGGLEQQAPFFPSSFFLRRDVAAEEEGERWRMAGVNSSSRSIVRSRQTSRQGANTRDQGRGSKRLSDRRARVSGPESMENDPGRGRLWHGQLRRIEYILNGSVSASKPAQNMSRSRNA